MPSEGITSPTAHSDREEGWLDIETGATGREHVGQQNSPSNELSATEGPKNVISDLDVERNLGKGSLLLDVKAEGKYFVLIPSAGAKRPRSEAEDSDQDHQSNQSSADTFPGTYPEEPQDKKSEKRRTKQSKKERRELRKWRLNQSSDKPSQGQSDPARSQHVPSVTAPPAATSFEEKENDSFNITTEPARLLRQMSSLKFANASLERQLAEEKTRHFKTIEELRVARSTKVGKYPGINPNLVTDLAMQLIEGGPGVVGVVAASLLDEVSRGGGWETWPDEGSKLGKGTGAGGSIKLPYKPSGISNKTSNDSFSLTPSKFEKSLEFTAPETPISTDVSDSRARWFNPGQRLTVLEGVVDVTLKRLEAMEKKVGSGDLIRAKED